MIPYLYEQLRQITYYRTGTPNKDSDQSVRFEKPRMHRVFVWITKTPIKLLVIAGGFDSWLGAHVRRYVFSG